jgi:hypothetical protein
MSEFGLLKPQFEHDLAETLLLILAGDFAWDAELHRRAPGHQVWWQLSTSKSAPYALLRITQLWSDGDIRVRIELKAEERSGWTETIVVQDIREVRRVINWLRAKVGLSPLF